MVGIPYPQLAAHLFGCPLMIHPGKVDAIIAGLGSRLMGAPVGAAGDAVVVVDMQTGEQRPRPGAYTTVYGELREPGYRVIDGVGVVDIFGVLAHHGRMAGLSSYVQGYGDMAATFEAALDDDQVKAIVLNIDSPGGEVSGAFDLAEQIYAARGSKPIHAVAGDLAASAAYLIASAADTVSITRTGQAGSIGVVMRHIDASARMAQDGFAVTNIHAGAHKVDGNPFEALSPAVHRDMQAEVDRVYDLFVDSVAKYRRMESADVRGTEARVFAGQQAVNIGLADQVETPDSLIARLSGRADNPQEAIMTTSTQAKGPGDPVLAKTQAKNYTQADMDAARNQARDEGAAIGATSERVRINAIVTSEAAKGKQLMALALALSSDIKLDAAVAVMTAMKKDYDATRLTPLGQAMEANGTSSVGDGGGDGAERTDAMAILADFSGATGIRANY